MNSDILAGKWEQIKGRLNEVWGDLTDSDTQHLKGSFQESTGYLQQKYGETKENIHKFFSSQSDWDNDWNKENTADWNKEKNMGTQWDKTANNQSTNADKQADNQDAWNKDTNQHDPVKKQSNF